MPSIGCPNAVLDNARHLLSQKRCGVLKTRLLHGHAEITAPNPHLANNKKHPWPFAR
jgi:hypothetical protein